MTSKKELIALFLKWRDENYNVTDITMDEKGFLNSKVQAQFKSFVGAVEMMGNDPICPGYAGVQVWVGGQRVTRIVPEEKFERMHADPLSLEFAVANESLRMSRWGISND